MWLCLLLYCCYVFVRINGEISYFAASSTATSSSSSDRSAVSSVPRSNYRTISDRRGHERDLMVVLPVMQGDSNLGDSNLQHLYTKAPITRIIGDGGGGGENLQQTRNSHAAAVAVKSTTPKTTIERRIDLAAFETNAPSVTKRRLENRQDRRPYTADFLIADKTTASNNLKLPLDYGYPDSFKFVQELNELPKNHKPHWASSEQIESTGKGVVESMIAGVVSSTSYAPPPLFQSTKNDPFQMFESVKPLEINKLLSLKQSAAAIGVTDSWPEENTTTKKKHHESNAVTKRPSAKRPPKKPQKNKTNGYNKIGGGYGQQVPIIIDLGTTWRPSTSVFATENAGVVSRVDPIIAPQYSTTLFETSKFFLPTPYTIPFDNLTTKKMETTTTTTTSSTTTETATTSKNIVTITNATTLTPNFAWTNITVAAGSPTTAPNYSILKSAIAEVKPSDLVSLNKLLAADYVPKSTSADFLQRDITTTKYPFPNDDPLTKDMKNMLIALGILRAENNEPIFAALPTITSTTKNILAMLATTPPKSQTPTIDPYSYVSFKKIPDKSSVSDDMRDFLASFGLLPKQMTSNRGGFRQQKRLEISSSSSPPPNLLALKRPNTSSHIFRPVVELRRLYDERKTRRVNDALNTIRKLSSNENVTATNNFERLESQLENITAFLRREETDDGDVARTTIAAERTRDDAVSAKPTATALINETIPVRPKSNYPHRSSAIIEDFNAAQLPPPKKLSSNELSKMLKINEEKTRTEFSDFSTTTSIADSHRAESFNANKLAPPPAAKPIGARLYVDWNTFFNIGQTDKRLLAVGFSPKAGNPTHFTSITVP